MNRKLDGTFEKQSSVALATLPPEFYFSPSTSSFQSGLAGGFDIRGNRRIALLLEAILVEYLFMVEETVISSLHSLFIKPGLE